MMEGRESRWMIVWRLTCFTSVAYDGQRVHLCLDIFILYKCKVSKLYCI